MNGVQETQTENVAELLHYKDEERIFYEFIDTLKAQVIKLKTNELILSDLNKKKVELHQTQWEEYEKLLDLQRMIDEELVKNSNIRDEIMYTEQRIHLKEKILAGQDSDLLRTTDKISNAFNNYLAALDIKIKFKQKSVLNAKTINFEVLVNTAEVCLAYDLISERFDLIRLHPPHPNFEEIQKFLRQNADVSGLFVSVYLWMAAKIKNHDLNS